MMPRRLEPELMDDAAEVDAYAAADFRTSNARYVAAALQHVEPALLGGRSPTLLDIGCGPGEITIAVGRARSSWQVIGVDASEAMLAVARERTVAAGMTNVRFAIEDAKALVTPAQLYDAVISNSLLHHLPEPRGFWASVGRVLRPGGTFFLRDLRRPATENEARDIVERHAGSASPLLKEEFFRSLLAAFTLEEVREQLSQASLGHLIVSAVEDRYLDVVGTL